MAWTGWSANWRQGWKGWGAGWQGEGAEAGGQSPEQWQSWHGSSSSSWEPAGGQAPEQRQSWHGRSSWEEAGGQAPDQRQAAGQAPDVAPPGQAPDAAPPRMRELQGKRSRIEGSIHEEAGRMSLEKRIQAFGREDPRAPEEYLAVMWPGSVNQTLGMPMFKQLEELARQEGVTIKLRARTVRHRAEPKRGGQQRHPRFVCLGPREKNLSVALCAVSLLEDKWKRILKRTRWYLAAAAGNEAIRDPDDVQSTASSSDAEEGQAEEPKEEAKDTGCEADEGAGGEEDEGARAEEEQADWDFSSGSSPASEEPPGSPQPKPEQQREAGAAGPEAGATKAEAPQEPATGSAEAATETRPAASAPEAAIPNLRPAASSPEAALDKRPAARTHGTQEASAQESKESPEPATLSEPGPPRHDLVLRPSPQYKFWQACRAAVNSLAEVSSAGSAAVASELELLLDRYEQGHDVKITKSGLLRIALCSHSFGRDYQVKVAMPLQCLAILHRRGVRTLEA